MIKILLILPCAGFFAWLGVTAICFPGGLLGSYGIKVATVDGFNEIRAVYGGLPLMWSALLFASLARPELRTPVALSVAAACIGMVAGRLVSAGIDQSLGRMPTIFLGIETAVAAALIASALVKSA
ncbi:DUF4345 family protein [Phenylobacterium sp.]|uniref:DUF4345 family protein n=1 Tax=Phenylobacterium sp. TaxID=1871053 RepID=UPI00286C79E7|nr:DUF4345 family protein [Phenylobacterium sp.]